MILNGNITIHPGKGRALGSQEFLTLLEQTIAQYYTNKDFDLGNLSAQMNISERQIQRKLKSLTAGTPSAYMRSYRLQRSLRLLLKGIPIREVAKAVGFSSQAYFASCFKAEFGLTPTDYQQR